jgi:hypothetical protein
VAKPPRATPGLAAWGGTAVAPRHKGAPCPTGRPAPVRARLGPKPPRRCCPEHRAAVLHCHSHPPDRAGEVIYSVLLRRHVGDRPRTFFTDALPPLLSRLFVASPSSPTFIDLTAGDVELAGVLASLLCPMGRSWRPLSTRVATRSSGSPSHPSGSLAGSASP